MTVFVRGVNGSPPIDVTDQVAYAIARKLRELDDMYFVPGDVLQLTVDVPIVEPKP